MINKLHSIRLYTYIVILLFFLNNDIYSRSFEGFISSQKDDYIIDYPIWVDIDFLADSGTVTGSYFYKHIGHELLLAGKSDGKNIIVTESDKKTNNVTGVFNLKIQNKKLCGTWNNKKNKDTLKVLLYNTNPIYKKYAKIPKSSELLLLENNLNERNTFADRINQFGGKIIKEDYDGEGVYTYTLFSRCNILSIGLHWMSYWSKQRYGTVHHTFDLSTRKEINLWDNFTPEFEVYVLNKLQKILTDKRSEHSDSVWLEESISLENISDVDELFTVTSIPNRSELFLKNDSLYFWLENYCELNHDSQSVYLYFDCIFGMLLTNIKSFIKKESILNLLFSAN